MYIIHLKPDQPEALSERIDEMGWVHKTGIKLYMFILSTYTGMKYAVNIE